MGLYFLQDIKYSFSGDLELDGKGDLKLADSFETTTSLVNFWVRTDHGDYKPDPTAGANIGAYIGQPASLELFEDVERSVYIELANSVVKPEDVQVRAAPLDTNSMLIAVKVRGRFLDDTGQDLNKDEVILTYDFPYMAGDPAPITEV